MQRDGFARDFLSADNVDGKCQWYAPRWSSDCFAKRLSEDTFGIRDGAISSSSRESKVDLNAVWRPNWLSSESKRPWEQVRGWSGLNEPKVSTTFLNSSRDPFVCLLARQRHSKMASENKGPRPVGKMRGVGEVG
jgi:hypothetical protein